MHALVLCFSSRMQRITNIKKGRCGRVHVNFYFIFSPYSAQASSCTHKHAGASTAWTLQLLKQSHVPEERLGRFITTAALRMRAAVRYAACLRLRTSRKHGRGSTARLLFKEGEIIEKIKIKSCLFIWNQGLSSVKSIRLRNSKGVILISMTKNSYSNNLQSWTRYRVLAVETLWFTKF